LFAGKDSFSLNLLMAPADFQNRPSLLTQFQALGSKQWPRYLFLAVIGFLVHLPALQGQLVWDDDYLARDNPFIKSPVLAIEAFRHYLFLDSYSPHYRPVQNLSFMADYYFWNNDPTGFHLTNILLHLGSGLLLYRLLTLLLSESGGMWKNRDPRSQFVAQVAAFAIAAMWIVHPVHSAAVDYISGRADSLAFLFAAAGWLFVLRGRTVQSRGFKSLCYALAAICALLSLCSREIACVWIVLFLVHTLAFAKDLRRKTKAASVIVCMLILVAYVGLHQLPGRRPEKGGTENWAVPVRATLMLRALGDYGRLMVFPANLHMERTVFDPALYRNRQGWRASIGTEYLSIVGLCVCAAFAFGCLKNGAGHRMRVLGAIWFFAGYLPVSNIAQLNATVAEHWLYLPSVGFLIFLVGCALDVPPRFQRLTATAAMVGVVALALRSGIRSTDWSDPETFYSRTLAAGGTGARVEVNLAMIYGRRGEYAKAEKLFRHVLQVTPDYPVARSNLADLLSREGKTAEAEALLAHGIKNAAAESKDYPRTWIGVYNLAGLRHNANDDAEAIALLDRARGDYPQVWELIRRESELIRRTQGPVAALHLAEDFVRKNWWHHAARLALGRLYAEKGDVDDALQSLRCAAILDVHDVEALDLFAAICVRQQHLQEALDAQRRAVARQPDQPRQYLLLSDVLQKMGRSAEAQMTLAKVSRLKALALEQPVVAN
jgi:Putative Zn-dependent protease, contains TPR repeats